MAKHRIDIKGVMIPNSYADFYRWFGEDCTCPKDVNDVLSQMIDGDELEVYINSPGGVIDVGSEIYTVLRNTAQRHNVKIYITGQACSAASVAACAAYCEMSPTALMMVHCVSCGVNGNHNDMEHMAEVLRTADRAMCQAYTDKTGMTEEEALDMMEHETWLTAQQALERGLVDKIMFQEEESLPLVAGPAFRLPTKEQLEQVKALMEGRKMEDNNAAPESPVVGTIPADLLKSAALAASADNCIWLPEVEDPTVERTAGGEAGDALMRAVAKCRLNQLKLSARRNI